MAYLSAAKWIMAMATVGALTGCKNRDAAAPQSAPSDSAKAPGSRRPPEWKTDPTAKTIPMADMLAKAQHQDGGLPAGHPPVGTTLPAGHPPVGGAADPVLSEDVQKPEDMLDMTPPPSWQVKPARRMTVAVYNLPKAEGSEDAELTISHYPGMKGIPLDAQVQRWAGQFQQPEGKTPAEAVKQAPLDKAAHPTTLIDITGRYTASSMMGGGTSAPKDNYQMLVGYLEAETGPWFFKLVGPQATVAAHREEFLKFLREAK